MPSPLAIARAILEGFDNHYRRFRYVAQQAKALFENGNWHAIRERARERIDFYDFARQRGRHRHRAQFRSRFADRRRTRCALAGREAKLRRIARRSPSARVRRNVFQLRVYEDPASRLLSQPLHLRATGGRDRIHGLRSAFLSQLLPGDRGTEARFAKDHHRLRIGKPMGRRRARHSPRRSRGHRCAPRADGVHAPVARRTRLSAADSVEPFFSQQRRLHRRPGCQRHAHHAGRGTHFAQRERHAVHRHGAFYRRSDDGAVLFHARLLSSSTWKRPRRISNFCGRFCRASRARSFTRASVWRSRGRRCFTATSCTI